VLIDCWATGDVLETVRQHNGANIPTVLDVELELSDPKIKYDPKRGPLDFISFPKRPNPRTVRYVLINTACRVHASLSLLFVAVHKEGGINVKGLRTNSTHLQRYGRCELHISS